MVWAKYSLFEALDPLGVQEGKWAWDMEFSTKLLRFLPARGLHMKYSN